MLLFRLFAREVAGEREVNTGMLARLRGGRTEDEEDDKVEEAAAEAGPRRGARVGEPLLEDG